MCDRTLKLLHDDDRDNKEIAAGAGVNGHWLAKFRQGVIANPGVRTVERLHDFLSSGKPHQPISAPASGENEVAA